MDYTQFLKFDRNNQLQMVQLDSRYGRTQLNWGYTLALWVRTGEDIIAEADPWSAKESAHVFKFENVLEMYFESKLSVKFFVNALKNYQGTTTKALTVPMGQWANIQFTIGQYTGYEIRLYDIQRRLQQRIYEPDTNFYEQLPNGKLHFFSYFRGYARDLLLYGTKRTLPVWGQPGAGSISTEANLLAYFNLARSNIAGSNAYVQSLARPGNASP